MTAIFAASFLAVFKIVLVCLIGTWLARRDIMNREFRRKLSQVIIVLMLPCFFVSKLGVSVSIDNLMHWGTLPLVAIFYVAAGLAVGRGIVGLIRPPAELRRVATAATAFGNSGYIPFPLVAAIAATAACFREDPGAADRGIAYVSVFLVGLSPCFWIIGYPYLSHRPLRDLEVRQILSPPLIGIICGVILGAVGPLNRLLVCPGAPLRVCMDTVELIGTAAIPCALLIMGANLGDIDPKERAIEPKLIFSVGLGKLVIMPLLGCAVVLGLRRMGLIPNDPMCALVLMIEAAVPPATNLMVMCQAHHKGEAAMSKLLFWSYIAAVPILTIFVAVFLGLVSNM